MKKAWIVAAALAAMSISSAAHAVPSFTNRTLRVDGTALTLGQVNFLPIGATGTFPGPPGGCAYQVAWISPQNPNDVQTCLVVESRTNFAPSCIANSMQFVNGAILTAALGACTGFDILGVARPTQLMLGSNAAGLSGLALEIVGGLVATFPVVSP